jgi:hypothetical protein
MATDTSGNQAVDFVWGNFPTQPNTERGTTATNTGGTTGDYGWAQTTQVGSGLLNPALDNHANVEAGWAGYPNYVAAEGNYIVTAVSGDGTTVTYTSQNFLAAGQTVNITGLTASAYNLSGATVASSNATSFKVTNSANAGIITGQTGKVQSTTAITAADGVGVGNIIVPSVLGLTTAAAITSLKKAGYETASITTAAAATNAVSTVTAVVRTLKVVTLTSAGAGAKYPTGTSITVAGLSGDSAAVNGTFVVTGTATNSVTYSTTTSGTISATGLTAEVLTGAAGTVKTQSTAANAAGIATDATITITPWDVAS